ncbi:MgtE intracellular region [Acidothermus cellulolyticus 11B]|uniref:MgtE intracellular region n=1 Tax=Acidothermus cellulolyticus (strain ATCC 43068 / DSM 8971 / 11B) TaxID=351607 RepID=A0LVY0_ACIC1|nr:CBS domain-containing protein [Acidothermus cellulolyticus]ABK53590.1 MgtE intracellular region [Acidothermus cellulolyticus 11B]MBX5448153.1 CBS domain-containing protein [Acidothermus cellulolyticus]MCL6549743.1 CBS domain-containing protein [Acidothermus cellulolyticus]
MAIVAPPRVFVARLAGVQVFDPNGDPVGRIRDVVVLLRLGAQQPRVLGLVVEVPPRRPIFIPMTRVTSIEAGAVVVTGAVNLRRFARRAAETLVLGELLDRNVVLIETGETVTVTDVAMEQTRTRDWYLTKVAVRRGRGRMRRRGEIQVVDWSAVRGLSLPETSQGAASLLAAFDQLRPADLAGVIHDLSEKRRAEVAAALDDERLADVLEELPEEEQVAILATLEGRRAADVLEAMGPDDAADLLAELPPDEAERLLSLMDPEEAEPVRRLLTYSENTAGGLMTTEPVILPPSATVAEALARVRNPDLTPATASQVYVCRPPTETPTGRYLGIAHLQRLLREPPGTLVSAVVDTDIAPLPPSAPLPEVARYLATYNLVAIPVVDDDDRLLGAVTVDDVLDHLLPEGWRDEAGSDDVADAERQPGDRAS